MLRSSSLLIEQRVNKASASDVHTVLYCGGLVAAYTPIAKFRAYSTRTLTRNRVLTIARGALLLCGQHAVLRSYGARINQFGYGANPPRGAMAESKKKPVSNGPLGVCLT